MLIVGCGIAGLYASLNLPEKLNIVVLSKKNDSLSNSSLAQGGVAAVLSFEDDSFELHEEDTMIAGQRANDFTSVKTLVEQGPDQVRKLIDYGVDFDKNEDGSLQKTLEGGHCRRRIVHHKDTTGAEIVEKLLAEIRRRPNIELIENAAVFRLHRIANGICANVLISGGQTVFFADYCILATGGIGRVYRYTTNPKVATGDGIRLAYELGANIKNLSYIQFHPTAFNSSQNEQFLISEAVRGEGAYLLNCNKERFMDRYDERLELAPRDVVSKSIIIESRRTGSNQFYLDITHRDRDYILNRFPGIYEGCLKYGVDITKDLIPVFPCQHYLMGGIQVDLNGRTGVNRLYAIGECSNTGVHGKNRLASNSLLEALVWGKRTADDIAARLSTDTAKAEMSGDYSLDLDGAPLIKGLRTEIQNIMQRSYFVMPANEDVVRMGYKRVGEILTRLKNGKFKITPEYSEILSLATVAYIILREVNENNV